ncbi:MAG: hypothetical protein JST80_06175 [Bdellovibrionales bacterium]|nr:hypothetical protein [Bdellovibrionales bacterium]
MKPYLFFKLGLVSCLLTAPAQAQNKDEISKQLASFNKPSDWVAPADANFKDAWAAKIQANLSNPEFVKKNCGSNYSDRHSEETKAEFADIRRDVIVFDNICLSELTDANLKTEAIADFQKNFQNESLHSYFSKDSEGHAMIVYFTPVYACIDKGTGDAEKEVTRRKLKFGIGSEAGTKTRDTGYGCMVNQPSEAVNRLQVAFGFDKTTDFKPGKYVEEKNYVAKLDTKAYKASILEKIKKPENVVLDDLTKHIAKKKLELETKLKQRPLFEVPSSKSNDDNYVFMIDRTGSFQKKNGVVVPLKETINELITSINNYPKDKSFSLSFFGTATVKSSIGPDDLFNKGRLTLATDANKKAAIDWLKGQKNLDLVGRKVIKNEYATVVMEAIQKANPGVATNTKFYSDGRISIDSDNENASKSIEERKKVFDFIKGAKDGSFTYYPMGSDYSNDFAAQAKQVGKVVEPDAYLTDSASFFKNAEQNQKEYQTVLGEWETVQSISKELNSESPFLTSDIFKSWMDFQKRYVTGNASAYPSMNDAQAKFQKELTDFNLKISALPDIVKKYAIKGTFAIPAAEYLAKHKTGYKIGNTTRVIDGKSMSVDGVVPNKTCK